MISDRIKEYRIQRGWTQSELGKMLHVTNKAISSWETGRTEPNMGNIEDLAAVFHCKKSDLLEDHDADYQLWLSREDNLLIEQYHQSDSLTRAMIRRLLAIQNGDNDGNTKKN